MVEHHVTKHLENLSVQKAGKSYLGSVHLTLILAHTNWILHSFSDPPTRSTNRNLFSNYRRQTVVAASYAQSTSAFKESEAGQRKNDSK